MSRTLPALLRAVGVSAALAISLVGIDRLLLGPGHEERWRAVGEPPPEIPSPSYLPDTLHWPPELVLIRSEPAGWWAQLGDQQGATAWLGLSGSDPPDQLGELASCLADRGCPSGAHMLSSQGPAGNTVLLICTLPERDAVRVLQGLRFSQRR